MHFCSQFSSWITCLDCSKCGDCISYTSNAQLSRTLPLLNGNHKSVKIRCPVPILTDDVIMFVPWIMMQAFIIKDQIKSMKWKFTWKLQLSQCSSDLVLVLVSKVLIKLLIMKWCKNNICYHRINLIVSYQIF